MENLLDGNLRALFDLLDANHDDQLSKVEVMKGLTFAKNPEVTKILQETEALAPLRHPKSWAGSFKAMDTNRDGHVTLEELRSFVVGLIPSAIVQASKDDEIEANQQESSLNNESIDVNAAAAQKDDDLDFDLDPDLDPWDGFELTSETTMNSTHTAARNHQTLKVISSNPYHLVARTRYECAEAIATLNVNNMKMLIRVCAASFNNTLEPEREALESVLQMMERLTEVSSRTTKSTLDSMRQDQTQQKIQQKLDEAQVKQTQVEIDRRKIQQTLDEAQKQHEIERKKWYDEKINRDENEVTQCVETLVVDVIRLMDSHNQKEKQQQLNHELHHLREKLAWAKRAETQRETNMDMERKKWKQLQEHAEMELHTRDDESEVAQCVENLILDMIRLFENESAEKKEKKNNVVQTMREIGKEVKRERKETEREEREAEREKVREKVREKEWKEHEKSMEDLMKKKMDAMMERQQQKDEELQQEMQEMNEKRNREQKILQEELILLKEEKAKQDRERDDQMLQLKQEHEAILSAKMKKVEETAMEKQAQHNISMDVPKTEKEEEMHKVKKLNLDLAKAHATIKQLETQVEEIRFQKDSEQAELVQKFRESRQRNSTPKESKTPMQVTGRARAKENLLDSDDLYRSSSSSSSSLSPSPPPPPPPLKKVPAAAEDVSRVLDLERDLRTSRLDAAVAERELAAEKARSHVLSLEIYKLKKERKIMNRVTEMNLVESNVVVKLERALERRTKEIAKLKEQLREKEPNKQRYGGAEKRKKRNMAEPHKEVVEMMMMEDDEDEIENVESVTADENLEWDSHVLNVSKKNQTAPFISASKRMLPKMEQDHAERLEMAYNRLRERKNALSTTL